MKMSMESKVGSLCDMKERNKVLNRKKDLENYIMHRRLNWRSTVNPLEAFAEEAKEDLKNMKCNVKKRKKIRRCWNCSTIGHLKDFCPEIKCYWCFQFGHTKRKCQYYLLVQIQKSLNQNQRHHMKSQKYAHNLIERLNSIQVVREENKVLIEYEKRVIGEFIGDPIKIEDIKKIHEEDTRNIEKKINRDLKLENIKHRLNPKMFYQCKCEGNVFDYNDFLRHTSTEHKGIIPKGTSYNLLPFREMVLFYDEDDFLLVING